MDNTYLRALCESVSKIPVPPLPTYSHQGAPVYLPPTPDSVSSHTPHNFTYQTDYKLTPSLFHCQPPTINCYQEYPTSNFNQFSHSGHLHQTVASLPVPLTSPFLTPPSTPTSNSSTFSESTQSVQVHDSIQESTNPVLRNKVANEQFKLYLNETWPEEPPRRSSSVIRASLYLKIAETLRDESAKGRLKHWVKHSGFFMIENDQPRGECRACLAVPAVKGRGCRSKMSKGPIIPSRRSHSYKLVARLEDFGHIIGTYHNDSKGHHGIRKTYAMVQEDFSYVPRAAVAKYIELCDTCSVYRTKVNRQTRTKKQSEKHTQSIDISTAPCANEGTTLRDSNSVLGICDSKTQENVAIFDKAKMQNEGESTINCPGTRDEEVLAEKHLDNIIHYIHTSSNCV